MSTQQQIDQCNAVIAQKQQEHAGQVTTSKSTLGY
jgi:N-acetylmuramoyl-L-alanine amidase CwlA